VESFREAVPRHAQAGLLPVALAPATSANLVGAQALVVPMGESRLVPAVVPVLAMLMTF
jgi:hypothetical protein